MELNVKEYVKMIARRWWIVALIVAIGSAATAWIQSSLISPVYEASSKLIISTAPEATSDAGAGGARIDFESVRANVALIGTYMEIMTSPMVLDEVAARLPEMDLTGSRLQGMVKVGTVPETQVLDVYVRDTSYERAAKIAATVTEVFRERVSQMLGVNNVAYLNEANPDSPSAPVNRSMTLFLALSFVASAIVGIGAVTMMEAFNDTVRTEEDLERHFGIGALALVPTYGKQADSSVITTSGVGERKHVTINP
ncbi:MAG TPA: Wzz/FepE/Etk N-terminal domain-containing protein [Paenibacillus sp.]|uniref:YveK family protein n=1 Tax=Paenibacillus sp. TaxID=58172 RepID=UPI002B909DE6|nr:Wzz/FepE/Etk N-terminal domain-containing protein [Paenibacillus sp.]HUC92449.1 Wzz/FepE/Etk N-terminal domain-containing protein [Paenibacillus sp.]